MSILKWLDVRILAWMMDHKRSVVFCTKPILQFGVRVRFVRHATDDSERHNGETGDIHKVVWLLLNGVNIY